MRALAYVVIMSLTVALVALAPAPPVQTVQWGSDGWYVAKGPNEGGNVTAELAYFQSHRSEYPGGIFLDDFEFTGAYNSFYASHLNDRGVCPVLYPYVIGTNIRFPQPFDTVGAACVVLAVIPPASSVPPNESAWVAAILQDVSMVKAQNVHLLAYGTPPSYWESIPPGYAEAVSQVSRQTGEFEVIWN